MDIAKIFKNLYIFRSPNFRYFDLNPREEHHSKIENVGFEHKQQGSMNWQEIWREKESDDEEGGSGSVDMLIDRPVDRSNANINNEVR